jgi:hypothetical protein
VAFAAARRRPRVAFAGASAALRVRRLRDWRVRPAGAGSDARAGVAVIAGTELGASAATSRARSNTGSSCGERPFPPALTLSSVTRAAPLVVST